ncbi:helix-turn-helix domain-containing protein [Runella slithyformis]|uniref:Helix-turn-helix domain protein n=1 Tax=Runella slithyformis (strain ATCC 29530 / DSM 19594 / LMG 11500 / NCIMB 11436 / LSU 4) TaxID=761193 RepID=A0A7U3ZHM5_RUNSL|nr:helix-turn-helix transcriptional regulator [Runella slithyformis]AEI47361.1 helix-turn-helix domain protein [Runella slithyformis DSM 19594]
MLIGDTLRQLRKAKGIKQPDMAEMLGVSHTTYSRIENNQAALDANLLPKIAKEFELPVEALFQENGKIVLHNPIQHNAGTGIMVQNGLTQQERQQYERVIASQQETISVQKAQIELLQAEVERLRS